MIILDFPLWHINILTNARVCKEAQLKHDERTNKSDKAQQSHEERNVE